MKDSQAAIVQPAARGDDRFPALRLAAPEALRHCVRRVMSMSQEVIALGDTPVTPSRSDRSRGRAM
jgi:hypothetical protein